MTTMEMPEDSVQISNIHNMGFYRKDKKYALNFELTLQKAI